MARYKETKTLAQAALGVQDCRVLFVSHTDQRARLSGAHGDTQNSLLTKQTTPNAR